MATWKKIIVSGSNAELAQVTASIGVLVGSTQIIGTTQAATRLTGSFTGSFTGGFTGDGTGLTGVTATPSFPTTATTNLASTDKFFVNDDAGDLTSGNKKFTYGNLLTDLAGSGISVEGTDSLSVNSGSMQTFFNSSSYAGISGDILINASSGVASIQENSVALGTDTTGDYVTSVSASGALVSSALSGEGSTPNITLNTASTTFTSGVVSSLPTGTVSGSSLTTGGQGSVTLTTNGVAQVVDLALETGDSPQFVGLTLTSDLAVNGGDITTSATTFNVATGTATTINVGTTDATTINLGKAGTSTVTVNDKLVVTGDLVVNGTTTTVDTTNITIEDKFALFASGSDGSTDGGIIVQQGATDGYALGVDASADRWALQNNLGPTATVIVPDAFMGVIQQWANVAAQPVSPQYGGVTGFGTIGVQTDTGDVWIYS
jgi:hypothetical protein